MIMLNSELAGVIRIDKKSDSTVKKTILEISKDLRQKVNDLFKSNLTFTKEEEEIEKRLRNGETLEDRLILKGDRLIPLLIGKISGNFSRKNPESDFCKILVIFSIFIEYKNYNPNECDLKVLEITEYEKKIKQLASIILNMAVAQERQKTRQNEIPWEQIEENFFEKILLIGESFLNEHLINPYLELKEQKELKKQKSETNLKNSLSTKNKSTFESLNETQDTSIQVLGNPSHFPEIKNASGTNKIPKIQIKYIERTENKEEHFDDKMYFRAKYQDSKGNQSTSPTSSISDNILKDFFNQDETAVNKPIDTKAKVEVLQNEPKPLEYEEKNKKNELKKLTIEKTNSNPKTLILKSKESNNKLSFAMLLCAVVLILLIFVAKRTQTNNLILIPGKNKINKETL